MDDGFVGGSEKLRYDPTAAGRRGWYGATGRQRPRTEIRHWAPGVAVIVALTIWGYVSIAPNGRLEPGHIDRHRTDFTVFTEAGAAFFDGRDPYKVTNPRGWHYLYPPLFALLVAPLSVFDTESQVVIWYIVNVTLAFGCFGEARMLWRLVSGSESRRWRWVPRLALLTVFLPFLDCMQAGQLGIAILYLLMLGFRHVVQYQSRTHWLLGGLILSLPASVKLVPSLPVALLLLQRWSSVVKQPAERRILSQAVAVTAGVVTGAFLFMLAIPASLIGWRANLDYLNVWRTRVVTNERVGPNSNFNIHSFRNQSLANAVYLFDKATASVLKPGSQANATREPAERIVHPIVRVLDGVIVAALLSVCWLLGRRNDGLSQATAYGLACSATLVISPISWGHYYMAESLAVLMTPLWLLRCGMPTHAKVVAVVPVVLSWSYYLAQPYAGGIGLLGLGTTVWFLSVCGLILGTNAARSRPAHEPHFRRRARSSARAEATG
jgi:hypothetical protein